MLNKLRNKKTAKKIWIILAFIVVPPFVLWGSGSLLRSGKKETAIYIGKIFGKKVSADEYRQAKEAVKVQMIMQFGDNFSQLEKFLNLDAQAIERLILLSEVNSRKISSSDQEVIENIAVNPYFSRRGQFNQKIYNEVLRYVFRIQPRAFEELTRQNLNLSKLYKQVTQDIQLSDSEARNEYQRTNQEISLDYIAAMDADFSKDIPISDEELKSYFVKNSAEFKQPLSYNIEYVLADTQEKLQNLRPQLNDKKADIAKLLKEAGITLNETGLFSLSEPIPGIGWSQEVLSLLSDLETAEFSSCQQIDKKYYLFRLKEKKDAYIPEYDKIRDKVKKTLVKEKAGEAARLKCTEALKKIKELSATDPKSVDFTNIAGELGLKSDTTKPFKYGSYIEGIGASDNFWMAAANLKEDEFSPQLITTPSGHYIIRLKSRSPFDEKKFASEQQEFSKKLLAQKQQEFFSKFLEELKRKAQ
jgi:peptidyl-prolyl cis-trans isomerase D